MSSRRRSNNQPQGPTTASLKHGKSITSSRTSRTGTRRTTKTISSAENGLEFPDIPKKFFFENEIPQAFSQHLAFIGFVPLDQLPRALSKSDNASGRYVLRCVDHFGKYLLIITVYGDHCEIHYRIGRYRGKKTGGICYAVEGHRKSFKSIGLLLKYYTNESASLTNRLRCGYSLKKPMDRLSIYYPTRMIKQIGMIGEGNFCQVQKVEQIGPDGDERLAAMKACHVSNELKGTQAGRDACIEILHEARILSGFSNYTFITMFYGICFDEPIPKLIMELCPYGSVESYVTNKEVTITTAEKILMAHDISSGMQHLEECFCVHRDLAARNCLISAKGIVKVADFGLSRQARELESEKLRFNEFKAPVRWMAPECLTRHPNFSNKSDVWSFGMTLYEIFSEGCRPYEEEMDMRKVARKIRSYQHPIIPSAILAARVIPPELLGLMKSCWSKETLTRPPFAFLAFRLKYIGKGYATLAPNERCFKPDREQAKLIEPRDHCELKEEIQVNPDLWFIGEKREIPPSDELQQSDSNAAAVGNSKGKTRIAKTIVTAEQVFIHPDLPDSYSLPSNASRSKSKDSKSKDSHRSWRNHNNNNPNNNKDNTLNSTKNNNTDSISESFQKKKQKKEAPRSRSRRNSNNNNNATKKNVKRATQN